MQVQKIAETDSYSLRFDLQKSLTERHIDPTKLSTFQRILLTTDGTVTEMLEAHLLEKIQLVKLAEGLVSITKEIPVLDLKVGNEIIERKILLQGKISRKNFIYAESIIVPSRLEKRFKHSLLKSQEPIGRLWLEHKVETFKEIIDSVKEPAGELSHYFQIDSQEHLLSRTYRVFSQRKLIMMITEKFPESYFRHIS
ncbi:MAG TPA: chorismate pyruvate-lyase family protein [Phormidium sp.]